MKQTRAGSVLACEEVQPIIPMAMFLHITLRSGCPELDPTQAAMIMAELLRRLSELEDQMKMLKTKLRAVCHVRRGLGHCTSGYLEDGY